MIRSSQTSRSKVIFGWLVFASTWVTNPHPVYSQPQLANVRNAPSQNRIPLQTKTIHVPKFAAGPRLQVFIQQEKKIESLVDLLSKSVIQFGSGSGVIVDESGLVLTAYHVAPKAGRIVQVRLSDGSTANAQVLGSNRMTDAAALTLLGDRKWASIDLADSDQVHVGDSCLAFGYPTAFHRNKPAPVRLGSISQVSSDRFTATTKLMGGDSG
ncbi:MAG: trypsin-like peptidase domain-containing protein, partial [Planctomycetota bacterium]